MNGAKISKRTTIVVRYLCISVWLGVVFTGIGSYILYPHEFSAEGIAAFLLRFNTEIWVVYLLMSALRGISLLPSTPLVLAGTILFPQQPFSVLAVSLAGVVISSSMIFLFSEHLGLSDYFSSHKPELSERIRQKLDRPSGLVFTAAWAFFPLVPTDLVCYLAGTAKMNYLKFIFAIFVGESILCTFYIFLSRPVINSLF